MQINDQKELVLKCFQNVDHYNQSVPTHWNEIRENLFNYISEIFEQIESHKNEGKLISILILKTQTLLKR